MGNIISLSNSTSILAFPKAGVLFPLAKVNFMLLLSMIGIPSFLLNLSDIILSKAPESIIVGILTVYLKYFFFYNSNYEIIRLIRFHILHILSFFINKY